MPAPLSVLFVLPGFPLLATTSGQTACLGGLTVPETEASGQTASPGGQTTPGREAGGQTASPGSQTTPIQRLIVRP
jgi:hypothetical protein